MNIDIDKLELTIKKKYSFKYKPEFSESFTTKIKDNQIIPLANKVFEKLGWAIVFFDEKSIEAKRKDTWGKFTEKITITIKAAGRIKVHSKTLEGNFIDFGRNSKRTGIFIALFQKLADAYEKSDELTKIQTAHEKQYGWDDYEVPTELPKPGIYKEPNVVLSIVGGLIIAIIFGILVGFLTQSFTYIIGLYEVGIGFGIGYLFGQVLKKTNYLKFKTVQFTLAGMMLVMLLTNLFTQYVLITTKANISDLSFFEFLNLLLEAGLTIKKSNLGWIGLVISWLLQIVFPFILAQAKVAMIVMNHDIKKVPEAVIEYTIYLFEMGKTESEVRAELSLKGWGKKTDQQSIFHALVAIQGYKESYRE
ncbi:hypothetical protein [uncultured Kordia sp.]|uniref:hypothetical protein n=1 Tax=uncultured Kordia sp. TaxID=507699 RepID=UPI0026266C12|nr:hypothetical protein [uncultured Kordia sp.]